jgi:hypothetical protein
VKDCVWAQPMRYGVQLDTLLLLQRLSEHWASSAFSLQATRSFDGVKIVIPAVMTAIADATIRKRATDIPSEVSLHIMGGAGRGSGYTVSLGMFGMQSETIEVHTAELNIARTSVLDYFVDLYSTIDANHHIFAWENGNGFEGTTNTLMAAICAELAFPTESMPAYLSGEQYLIIKVRICCAFCVCLCPCPSRLTPNTPLRDPASSLLQNYPEWAMYRDIAFHWKFFCNSEHEGNSARTALSTLLLPPLRHRRHARELPTSRR